MHREPSFIPEKVLATPSDTISDRRRVLTESYAPFDFSKNPAKAIEDVARPTRSSIKR